MAWWLETLTTSHEARVRFSVLPWEFSLAREDPHSDHGLASLYNLGLRPLLVLHAPQTQKSATTRWGTTKSIWTCGGIRGGNQCFTCSVNNKQTNAQLIGSLLYCSLFIAPTCFNTNVSSPGSSYSVSAKLHKRLHAVLVGFPRIVTTI
jgi:hypothetical protein